MYLWEACIYGGAGLQRNKVGWQEAIEELRGSVKVRGEFSMMCLVNNVKKIMKGVTDGTVSLHRTYDKLMEEAMRRYRREQGTTLDIARSL